ncbi:BrxE family protein [Mesorhizobium sp. M1312]|uniref:BrxE family protein n=1 Tax=unclassified Mesorhizobium TaxID=325217 RepID=UPI00333D0523
MKYDTLANLLQARLLVGYLGESDQFAWWRTNFYQPASQHFLEPIFPRTSHLARYHGVNEAARRIHDESLSAGSYHLFRLPEELEQDLHALTDSDAGKTLHDKLPQDKRSALDLLHSLGGAKAQPTEGPTAIGTSADVRSSKIVGQMASLYGTAFERGIRCYPYLARQ